MKPVHKILVCTLFFAAYLLLGLNWVEDYGISYDEPFQLEYGRSVIQYVNETFELNDEVYSRSPLLERANRFHGPIYTTLAAAIETITEPEDTRAVYLLRHRLVFVLFWLTTVFFFFAGRAIGGRWWWGIVASGMLILSPRIFAHSFYNPKDLPNLCFYAWAGLSIFFYLRKNNWSWVILMALTTALAMAMRMTGIFLPAIVLVMMSWQYFAKLISGRQWVLRSIGYLALAAFMTVVFWPTLWDAPLARFVEAFQSMSNFPWEGRMLAAGQHVLSTGLPVWYLPLWITVTVPVLFLLLIGAALYHLTKGLFVRLREKRLFDLDNELLSLYALAALSFGPLLVIIIRNPVLYNGWRHVFFVYPFLLLCGFWYWTRTHRIGRPRDKYLSYALALNMAVVSLWMIRNHPHQQTYFNLFAGRQQFQYFDLDYWGLSYLQGYQELAKFDGGDSLRVKVAAYPGYLNLGMLPDSTRERFVFLEDDPELQEDYYLTHYWYWTDWREDYNNNRGVFSDSLVIEIKAGGNPIMGVYKVVDK